MLPLACSATSGSGGPPATPREPAATPIAPTRALAELYVAPNGDDANNGSSASPIRTVERAADLANPGTVVRVADGTYTGSLRTKASGTENARIAYVAENNGGAKIVGDGDGKGAAWRNDGDYVDIIGFDVTGSDTDGLTYGGSYGRVIGNRVHDFREGNCIGTNNENYTLHDIDVIGNVVFGCGEDELDHGIYVAHPNGVVANNMAYGNSGYGIHCWHKCAKLDVSNNLVFNNAEGGIVIGHPTDEDGRADGCVVSNNLVVDNGKEGIKESGKTGDNRYINNLVWDNGDKDMALVNGSQAGTIAEDPQFVNYRPDGSGDYRLRDSSPAVNAGTDTGAVPVTIDGTTRPQAGGYDIGIYEQ